MASLLKSTPAASETTGRRSGTWETEQVDHRCAWASFWVSFSSEAVGMRAAFLTSSRRVGMLELVSIARAYEDQGGFALPAAVVAHIALNGQWLIDGKMMYWPRQEQRD